MTRKGQRGVKGHRGVRGFTLIELLVVLLLLGLLVTFAVLRVGGDDPRELQREAARRVLARMDLAREEAVMQARSLGVRFTEEGYRFYALHEGDWQPLGKGGLLAPGEWPEAISIDVAIDGLEVTLGEGGDSDTDAPADKAPRPQIFFLAGGEIVPGFSIRVLSDDTDTEYRIAPGDEQWLTLSEHRF